MSRMYYQQQINVQYQASNVFELGDYLLSKRRNPSSMAIELFDGLHEMIEMGKELPASRTAYYRTADFTGTVGVYADNVLKGEIRLSELPRGTGKANVTVKITVDVNGHWTASIECDAVAGISACCPDMPEANTETDVHSVTAADTALSTVSAATESPVTVEKTFTHDSDNFESPASKTSIELRDDISEHQNIDDQSSDEQKLSSVLESTDDVQCIASETVVHPIIATDMALSTMSVAIESPVVVENCNDQELAGFTQSTDDVQCIAAETVVHPDFATDMALSIISAAIESPIPVEKTFTSIEQHDDDITEQRSIDAKSWNDQDLAGFPQSTDDVQCIAAETVIHPVIATDMALSTMSAAVELPVPIEKTFTRDSENFESPASQLSIDDQQDDISERQKIDKDLPASRTAQFRTADVTGTVRVFAGHVLKGEIRLYELPRGTGPANVTVKMTVDVNGHWTADIECDAAAGIPVCCSDVPEVNTETVVRPVTAADTALSCTVSAATESPVTVEKTFTHDSDNFESPASKTSIELRDDISEHQNIDDQSSDEQKLSSVLESTDDVQCIAAETVVHPIIATDMALSTMSAAIESPVVVEKTFTHDSENFECPASKLSIDQQEDISERQNIDAKSCNVQELANCTQSTDDVQCSIAVEEGLPSSDTDAIGDAGDETPEATINIETDKTPKKKKCSIWSWFCKGKYQLGHNELFGLNNNELNNSNIGNHKQVFKYRFQVPYPPSTNRSPEEDINGSLNSNDQNRRVQNKQHFNLPDHKFKQRVNLSHYGNKQNLNVPRLENKKNFNSPHHENTPILNSPCHENKQNSGCTHSDSSSMPIRQNHFNVSNLQSPETSHTHANNNAYLHVIKDNLCPESLNGSTIEFSSRKLVNSSTRDELVIAMNTYGALDFSWWTPNDMFFVRYISSYDAQHVYQIYTK